MELKYLGFASPVMLWVVGGIQEAVGHDLFTELKRFRDGLVRNCSEIAHVQPSWREVVGQRLPQGWEQLPQIRERPAFSTESVGFKSINEALARKWVGTPKPNGLGDEARVQNNLQQL